MILKDLMKEIVRRVQEHAHQMRENSAYSGSMNDGGSAALLNNLEHWLAGMEGRIPRTLKKYAEDIKRESDPEWDDFQRLTKKFGGTP